MNEQTDSISLFLLVIFSGIWIIFKIVHHNQKSDVNYLIKNPLFPHNFTLFLWYKINNCFQYLGKILSGHKAMNTFSYFK